MQTNRQSTLVLLSGGIDSALCLALSVARTHGTVGALHIDYGQAAAAAEHSCAMELARHYSVPLRFLRIDAARGKTAGVIPGRNAFLLTLALMECHPDVRVISLGIHAGTGYADCGPEFLRAMQNLFDLGMAGCIQVSAPLLHWRKADVYAAALTAGVPISMTHSCEASSTACGLCASCRDREALLARA